MLMADQRNAEEAAAIEAMNRYWDGVGAGRPTGTIPVPPQLDPELAAKIDHLQALGAAHPPESAFVEQLRHELFGDAVTTGGEPTLPPTPTANGRVRAVARPRPLSDHLGRPGLAPRRWPLTHFATAALLVLTLGSIYLLVRSQQPQHPPVPEISLSAPPDNGADTLLAVTMLSRDAIPDPFWADIWRVGIAPDDGFAVEAGHPWTDEPGTGVDSVLAGQVAVRSEGPIRVLRAGETEEVITADTEVVLGPGDAWVYPWEQPRVYANVGEASVELLMASVYTPGEYGPQPPAGYVARTGNWVNDTPASTLPPGPVELTLRRLVAGPGTPNPREITEGTEGLRLTIGEPMSTLEARSPLRSPLTGGQRTLYVLTLGIPTAPGGGPP
jgi:hypothetical protein